MLRAPDIGRNQAIGKVLTPAGGSGPQVAYCIELHGTQTVRLGPRQACIVPKGLRHRPVVPVCTAVLLLEQAGAVATGD
jgi:hypothetical protein